MPFIRSISSAKSTIFNGLYPGYALELTYSFASKKWEKETIICRKVS